MANPVTIVQGQNAPNVVVDNEKFVAATRRQRYAMQGVRAWSGIGATDSVQLKQEGVVAALEARVSGTITLGGTIGTTTASYDFPYNIVQTFQLSGERAEQPDLGPWPDDQAARLRAEHRPERPRRVPVVRRRRHASDLLAGHDFPVLIGTSSTVLSSVSIG